MLTREEQAEILRRVKEYGTWVISQRVRVQKGEVSAKAFRQRRKEREDDLADFLKECGGHEPHHAVQPLSNTQHLAEGPARVQARPQVPALRVDPLLCGQGATEP